MDEVVRRGAAFAEAGADMVFCFTRNPEEMRFVSERVPHPLMTFAPVDGFATSALSRADFAKLGFRLAASSGTAFAAMYKAARQSYLCLAQDKPDPFLGPGGGDAMMKEAQKTCGLHRLLEIERRTMKDE
jgi:2-methylisocitrate lyase-like PEP mutase family enzyme